MVCVACSVAVVSPAIIACTPSETGKVVQGANTTASFPDLASFLPPDTPNNWFVAPAGFSSVATADETAPVFAVPADTLAEIWRATIRSELRTTILKVSENGRQLEAEQRSAVFGFVDRISVKVLALDAQRSTFAAYSTSLVGYWDMGVNRGRLRHWIAEVRAASATAASPR